MAGGNPSVIALSDTLSFFLEGFHGQSPEQTPPVARDFVGPHQDIWDLGDELCHQLHTLADHKAAPEQSRAMPFPESEFLQNVFKLVSVAAPYVPGIAGQILVAVLPIISSVLGVSAPSTASNA